MAGAFDPYRDALVVETITLWPDGKFGLDGATCRRVEDALHDRPAEAADLEYVRLASGFCRQIRVTAADLERIRKLSVVGHPDPASGDQTDNKIGNKEAAQGHLPSEHAAHSPAPKE